MSDYTFDEARFYLGSLCRRGHDWNGTGQTLRRMHNKACDECEKLAVAKRKQIPATEPGEREDAFLGRLCKRGHDYEGTGKSLRYRNNSGCIECHLERYRANSTRPPRIQTISVDDKHYLGSLCKASHEYESTGKSLRRNPGGQCVICDRQSSMERYRNNTEEYARQAKLWKEQHPEKVKEIKAAYRERNREKLREKNRKYSERNKEAIRQKGQLYYQRPETKQRILEYYRSKQGRLMQARARHARRARKNQVHKVRYSNDDLQRLYNHFNNCCAFCGVNAKLTIDHFIPLSKNGPDVLGNLVPACSTCNCSKYQQDAQSWYQSQKFFDKQRWKKIIQWVGKDILNGQLPLF